MEEFRWVVHIFQGHQALVVRSGPVRLRRRSARWHKRTVQKVPQSLPGFPSPADALIGICWVLPDCPEPTVVVIKSMEIGGICWLYTRSNTAQLLQVNDARRRGSLERLFQKQFGGGLAEGAHKTRLPVIQLFLSNIHERRAPFTSLLRATSLT